MDQFNKVNQDNKLLKKLVKKKVEQSQRNTSKSKTITRASSVKTPKRGQTQGDQQKTERAKNIQATSKPRILDFAKCFW